MSNWFTRMANGIGPVDPKSTNYSNFLNNSFNNGWGSKEKKKQPKKKEPPAKENGKGDLLDVTASKETQASIIKSVWDNGHGRVQGSCGHTIKGCSCPEHAPSEFTRTVMSPCEKCFGRPKA